MASAPILITLVVYKVVLIAIGIVAERRTRDQADFLLGGRKLGPLVAAISASASSSSVWTLLGVSGFAFVKGLSALWLLPACIGGFALNWYVVAPRLRRLSLGSDALTLTDVLAGPRDGSRGRLRLARLATGMLVASLVVYVASQFQGAGKLFVEVLPDTLGGGGSLALPIVVGGSIVAVYTLLGGFWAVSLTDTLQGLMMAATAVVLPVTACIEVGGLASLWDGVQAVPATGYASLFGELGTAAAFGMVLGLLSIGVGYPGQPHVVNRFMALGSDDDVVRGRRYAMVWALLVYTGMVVVGLAGRVLLESGALADASVDQERIFFALNTQLFPSVIAGIMLAAVLSAIMSTADSQLLVAAAALSHDARSESNRRVDSLLGSRLILLGLSAVSIACAVYAPKGIFENVLFAWNAMGAAFGPLLLVILWNGRPSRTTAAVAMTTGFVGAVVFYTTAQARWLQWIPYLAAYAIARMGARDPTPTNTTPPT